MRCPAAAVSPARPPARANKCAVARHGTAWHGCLRGGGSNSARRSGRSRRCHPRATSCRATSRLSRRAHRARAHTHTNTHTRARARARTHAHTHMRARACTATRAVLADQEGKARALHSGPSYFADEVQRHVHAACGGREANSGYDPIACATHEGPPRGPGAMRGIRRLGGCRGGAGLPSGGR